MARKKKLLILLNLFSASFKIQGTILVPVCQNLCFSSWVLSKKLAGLLIPDFVTGQVCLSNLQVLVCNVGLLIPTSQGCCEGCRHMWNLSLPTVQEETRVHCLNYRCQGKMLKDMMRVKKVM